MFRGPTTPLTSVAISNGPGDQSLFAGSWDKSIWSWSSTTCTLIRRYFGHSDFINALLWTSIAGTSMLISGSSDANINIWNADTGERLHTLRGHTRGVLDLAIDPTTFPSSHTENNSTVVFSAGTDRTIRRWYINENATSARAIDSEKPIIQHETSVYCLRFDVDDDLWTASADGTTKCLSRAQSWQADTSLTHGDYVRSVAVDETGGWIATAGRDENVKIWDKATGKLHHTYEGHFDEVTGLVVVGRTVVSVSIDATVRKWSLQAEDLSTAKKAKEAQPGMTEAKVTQKKVGGMTEEEERELDELMSESE